MKAFFEIWAKKVVKFRLLIVGVWVVLLSVSAMYAAQIGARVKSHLARFKRLVNETMPKNDEIRIRHLVINRTSRKVYIQGNEVFFRAKEFDLLTYLASHPDQVLTKDDLFERIWGMEATSDNATVTVHIGKIRDKIERYSPNDSYIETVWGVGYRFRA